MQTYHRHHLLARYAALGALFVTLLTMFSIGISTSTRAQGLETPTDTPSDTLTETPTNTPTSTPSEKPFGKLNFEPSVVLNV